MDTWKYNLVLLVDDSEPDNFVNEQLLKITFTKKVIIKTSAKEALYFLKNTGTDEESIPDLIFLDIIMPVMDGFAFLEEFDKLSEAIRGKSKVIMLSSTESFKDLNKANKNKYVYKFINKPLDQELLDNINI